MADSLEGPRLKLNWANDHLKELGGEIQAFWATEPYGIELSGNWRTGQYAVELVRRRPTPPEFALAIGDCLHNLRSALDHAAWQLAIKHAGTPPKHTQFPIFLDQNQYKQLDCKGKPARGSGLWQITGLHPNAQIAIERMQPYHRLNGPPEMHPLWLLHNLSNEDKHRLLNLAAVTADDFTINCYGVGCGAEDVIQTIKVGPIVCQDRTMLGWIDPAEPPYDTIRHKGEGHLDIAFALDGPGGGQKIQPLLGDICALVKQILASLEPFLS